ncbi:MAG: hypothetical protein NWR03_08790 [Akkermansiaceae bacterium]|jgi:hypothetical protein|nr:hypothetical protein [Akkermansiaceae bacterium]MDP4897857.1 hypothetical protein [Akkermansiaceae bacterium]
MLPRPRAYTDWTVPKDASGNDIGICTEDVGYRKYLEWLADYLFTTDIPVPASQDELVAAYSEKGADHAVLDLSDLLGYSIWDTESIQEMSAGGQPFSEHHAGERKAWNELSEEEKEDWTEEDFFTSESDYVRLGEEFLEAQKTPSHIRHADIPYRPVLAALFKKVPDPKKRYELLDYFYRNFDECASK